MADETKVKIKAKVAQKIIDDEDINSYLPLNGELVAVNKDNGISLAIGYGNEDSAELQELNYVEGKANTFYVTAGQSTGTPGTRATAEGNGVTASGENSHAEGEGTRASGYASHAEGSDTIASDDYSHAEGGSTTASGYASHAEGYRTEAIGSYSHAEGWVTKATRRSQHVFGEYNISETIQNPNTKGTYVEIVGNGDDITRSNARTLDWSGNEWLAGKLTVGKDATNGDDVPRLSQIVSSSRNGLVPAISGVTTDQAILGAKKVNDVMVPQWLTLSGEGSISIPNVSEGAAGIVPAYGANAQDKILIIDENKNPSWVNAINKNLLPPSTANNGKYLMTQDRQYVWAEIVDSTSYNNLKVAINSPIDFIS